MGTRPLTTGHGGIEHRRADSVLRALSERHETAEHRTNDGDRRAPEERLLATVPRDHVARLVVGGGTLSSPMTLRLTDGTELPLEVTPRYRGRVERVAKLLADGAAGQGAEG